MKIPQNSNQKINTRNAVLISTKIKYKLILLTRHSMTKPLVQDIPSVWTIASIKRIRSATTLSMKLKQTTKVQCVFTTDLEKLVKKMQKAMTEWHVEVKKKKIYLMTRKRKLSDSQKIKVVALRQIKLMVGIS